MIYGDVRTGLISTIPIRKAKRRFKGTDALININRDWVEQNPDKRVIRKGEIENMRIKGMKI